MKYDLTKDEEMLDAMQEVVHVIWWMWSKDLSNKENLSPERIKRWKEECWKDYELLSQEEKDKDKPYAAMILTRMQFMLDLKEKRNKDEEM